MVESLRTRLPAVRDALAALDDQSLFESSHNDFDQFIELSLQGAGIKEQMLSKPTIC